MELRPLARRDLGLLIPYYSYPSAVWHEEMLALQEKELALYLVAWVDDLPTGVAVVAWGDGPVSTHAKREGCAELRTIETLDGHRRQGIGTAILTEVESAALRSGAKRIGLQVSFDNTTARSFYEKMGYSDAGHGLFPEEILSDNEQGTSSVCQYLIKTISH